MKCRVPHPHVTAKHIRHSAGMTAIVAMCVQVLHLPHLMEPALFGISAVLTVYEKEILYYFSTEDINVPEI